MSCMCHARPTVQRVETTPQSNLANGMRWFPRDDGGWDRPPWSWLCAAPHIPVRDTSVDGCRFEDAGPDCDCPNCCAERRWMEADLMAERTADAADRGEDQ